MMLSGRPSAPEEIQLIADIADRNGLRALLESEIGYMLMTVFTEILECGRILERREKRRGNK